MRPKTRERNATVAANHVHEWHDDGAGMVVCHGCDRARDFRVTDQSSPACAAAAKCDDCYTSTCRCDCHADDDDFPWLVNPNLRKDTPIR